MNSPALRLAARRGLLVLPTRGLAEGARLDGAVLRYDPARPQLELARAVLDVLRGERARIRGLR